MNPTPSQFEEFKLVTKFEPGGYTHTITDISEELVRYETWTRDETLGQGAYGTVYKEICIANGGVRAVKQIKGSSVRWDEIAVLARLRPYPEHFVQLIGWFEDGKHIYLAMEYLPCDLTTLLSDRNLSEDDAKRVTKQILVGLDIMHKKHICHRDVKPSNILIAQREPLSIKIADFGASKHFDNTQCRTELGTNCFMARRSGDFVMKKQINLVVFTRGRGLFTPTTAVARTIPRAAIDFIASMLRQLPQDRPSASEARLNPWLLIKEPHDTIQTHVLPNLNKPIPGPEPTQMVKAANNPVAAGAKRKFAPYLLDTPGPSKQLRLSGKDPALAAIGMLTLNTPGSDGQPRASSVVEQRESIQHLLVAAATSGNCKALMEALGNGATPMEDPSGYTPIYRAAEKGHLPIIELLLKHGAHLGVGGKHEVSALHGAARGGNIQIIQYLVDIGADTSATNKDRFMAHHIAAQLGATEVFRLLIERGADISAQILNNGWTALMCAAEEGHLNAARYILNRGVDISAVEAGGRMAHHIAAESGSTEVLQLLVERGADISAREASGDQWTALMYAAQNDHLNAARYLLDRGVDISAVDGAGLMAHHIAAQFGATEVLQLLVERGADISARQASKYQWTALMFATRNDHLNAARYLLDTGADISAVDGKGRMAHHIAAQFGGTEVLQLLVERGADISAREASEDQRTALMFAAWKGHLDTARYLLERGASASETNAGVTAMSLAANNGHTEIVLLLSDWYGKDTSISLTEHDNLRLSTKGSTQTTSENGSMTLWDSRA